MNRLKLVNQEKFLNSIMNMSKHVRYVSIYDLQGNVLYKQKMDGVVDLLTEEENKIALKHTVDSWNFRNTVSEKIGKAEFTIQVYEKLLRVIFPFNNEMLLIITLDNAERPNYIVERIQTILYGSPHKFGKI